jgi:hypothetical protein
MRRLTRHDIQFLQPMNDLTDSVIDFLLGILYAETLNACDSNAESSAIHIWLSIRINDLTEADDTAT